MTYFILPYNTALMIYALESVPGLPDVGVPHGDGDGSRTQARCLEVVRKKFQMTYFTLPNNTSFMKYALELVPGHPDVRVPIGGGDGSRTQPRCLEVVLKKF